MDREGPGPDYYYCKDDLVRPQLPKWTFAKEERAKDDDLPLDHRDLLNPDYDENLKPKARAALILGEHQQIFKE